MTGCTCGAGWPTFSGHRLDCPRNVAAGATRERVEEEDRADFEGAVPRMLRHPAWEPRGRDVRQRPDRGRGDIG